MTHPETDTKHTKFIPTPLELGTHVFIRNTGCDGEIIGVTTYLHDSPAYLVRYINALKLLVTEWHPAEVLSTNPTFVEEPDCTAPISQHPESSLAQELATARAALAYLSPDDYQEWITAGLALKNTFSGSKAAYAVWDAWSARSPQKYAGADDTWRRWADMQPSSVTMGTVYQRAEEAGWKSPWAKARERGRPALIRVDNTAPTPQHLEAIAPLTEAMQWVEKRGDFWIDAERRYSRVEMDKQAIGAEANELRHIYRKLQQAIDKLTPVA